MSDRTDKWQAFSDGLSRATWNLAKVFHFMGRIAGRISEELGYDDDFPFGRAPLERSPEEVNDTLREEYTPDPAEHAVSNPRNHADCDEDVCMLARPDKCPAQPDDQSMKYWFQN